jgi:hypothetical protein
MKRWRKEDVGHFPDSASFIQDLATPNFWEELKGARSEDRIIFTIKSGANHNAQQALDIIRSNDLFDRTVVLDEDEGNIMWHELQELYMKSRAVLTGLGDKVFYDLKSLRPRVFFIGFNGLEDRYVQPAVAKDIDVFFKSRVEGWLPHRKPFKDRLLEMDARKAIGNACIMPQFKESDGDPYLKLVSGDRHHPEYYSYLARTRIFVYLNGSNPIGYQFWEACANRCCIVHQTPWRSAFYNGGSANPQKFHWEHYSPPFVRGEDFHYFETPDDLEKVLLRLMADPALVDATAKRCSSKAQEFTPFRQAEKFLEMIL